MPSLAVGGTHLTYRIEGEGFPLVIIPDAGGTIHDWAPALPLLGELCRVIAYEYAPLPSTSDVPSSSDHLADDLVALLNALDIERAYVAGYARGGDIALRLAQRDPGRLEGLLCISPNPTGLIPPQTVSCLSVPTLVVAGEKAADHVASVRLLTAQLQHGTSAFIPEAGVAPHRERPLPLGHAMLTFLIRCERQRTLVRGASFLL